MTRVFVGLFILSMLALPLSPQGAVAQSTAGAASLQIPVDARGEGMGRVWAPLVTTPYAAWGNVGGLGLLHGVHVVKSDVQLVPGLADDVYHEYTSVAVGYTPFPDWTVPVNISLGYNRTFLWYGESVITDPGSPDPIGTFESSENVKGYTLALGFGDALGVGVGVKRIELNLAPPEVGDGRGKATAYDYGLLARSPYLVLGAQPEKWLSTGWKPEGSASMRAVGGVAWSNRGDGISLSDERAPDPLPRVRRESVGLELNILPVSRFMEDPSRFPSWLIKDVHVVRFSVGVGREDSLLDDFISPEAGATLSKNEIEGIVTYDGWEVALLDMVYYRKGSIFDDPGEIKGSTEGWGLSLFGYAGYDHAEIPQFRGLQRVKKESWWVRIPLIWP